MPWVRLINTSRVRLCNERCSRSFSTRGQCTVGSSCDGEIEIERKFRVTEGVIQYCESTAHQKKTISFTDTYYDNGYYDLTSKDMWLRERSGKWELKQPATTASATMEDTSTLQGLDFYQELTDISTIQERVQNSTRGSMQLHHQSICTNNQELLDWLLQRKISPFGRIQTTRTRYSLSIPLTKMLDSSSHRNCVHQSVFIDVDRVLYDPKYISQSASRDQKDLSVFSYLIGEIELAPPFAIEDRNQVMRDIFKILHIDIQPVRGKLLEYLKVFHPRHFEALEKSGQLASKGLGSSTTAEKK